MTSVRLRLLVLALLPLIVLMPLLLFLGMSRGSLEYDKVLIANVESDLRIAEQYLARIMATTGDELTGIAGSVDFAAALDAPGGPTGFLRAQQAEMGLDFLYYLDAPEAPHRPVIAAARDGRPATAIAVFSPRELAALAPALAARARIPLIATEAAVPTDRTEEDRGMVVQSAAPVRHGARRGVLVGGILLNGNLDFIDTINALVYLNPITGGARQGTATLFLDDVRISTNVRLFEGARALGTRVSAEVRSAVLDQGRTWLDRAFVVNDWYISAYMPLTDGAGARVGMLYVGFLEAPFTAAKTTAYVWIMAAFAIVLAISVPVFLWLAKGIFAPLERMTATMRRVGAGDLDARNGALAARDEIGQVARHLDDLLDQVQERDARLRAWAGELNQKVEERTAELRAANEKLEQTYRQLVMSEKLASIGEITAGVAHEINNPVAVIQGNVDVVREELGPAAARVATELDLIDRQVMRIAAIVGKLLQFARPGDFAAYDEAVALAPLVEDCLLLVEHEFSTRDIAVEKHFAEALPVRVEPGEMQQVIINLLVNARQAMGARGRLVLRIAPETRDGRDGTCLSLHDSGPGIAPGRIGAVFDPFFTTRMGEGTGLGLSISQTLIQRMGGLITAENAAGGGAIFTVWLPAADS